MTDKRPPLPGTTEESWVFVTMLRTERDRLSLKKLTLAYAAARRVTQLFEEAGIEEDSFEQIARNMALTEKRHGVSPRQLLFSQHAHGIIEGMMDGAWESERAEQPLEARSTYEAPQHDGSPMPEAVSEKLRKFGIVR